MDYKKINIILKKLLKLDCRIYIKDRLKQNLIKNIDKNIQKKSVVKKVISEQFIKKIDLILVSRSSSFANFSSSLAVAFSRIDNMKIRNTSSISCVK